MTPEQTLAEVEKLARQYNNPGVNHGGQRLAGLVLAIIDRGRADQLTERADDGEATEGR